MSHDAGGGMRWLLTYADLITLLLVFFIIVYAAAKADQTKSDALAEALSQAFSPLSSDKPFISPGQGTGKKILNTGQTANLQGAPTLVTQLKEAAILLENRAAIIRFYDEQLAIDLDPPDLFEPDGLTLNSGGKLFLRKVADILKVFPHRLDVAAYNPGVVSPASGAMDAWDLTSRQSVAIVMYLTEQCSVESAKLTALGLGPNTKRIGYAPGARGNGVSLLFLDESGKTDLK